MYSDLMDTVVSTSVMNAKRKRTSLKASFDAIRSKLVIIPSMAFSSLGPSVFTDAELDEEVVSAETGNVLVMIFSNASESCGVPGVRIGEGGKDRARARRCVTRDDIVLSGLFYVVLDAVEDVI